MSAPSTLWRRVADRSARKLRRRGLEYPLWVAASATVLEIGLAAGAVVQRDGPTPSWIAVGVVVVAASHGVQLVSTTWVSCWITASIALTGVAIIMSRPYDGAVDLAPAVLAILVAEVTASDGLVRGLVVTGAAWAVVALAGTPQPALAMGEIALGVLVGTMLIWQSRALVAERRERLREGERATLAERQRIAREIHDLVAHSMSVTLLQVTGARRALLDDDVAEAADALADAERVGREALNDIRRTVGLLADDQGSLAPQPTAADLPALLESMTAAGLAIHVETRGDLATVPDAIGLSLYRITQEALSNVVKHAPGCPAVVRVRRTSGTTTLEVTNPRPVATTDDGSGHGVAGMRARAEQLGAALRVGPQDDAWVVRLAVRDHPDGRACPLGTR